MSFRLNAACFSGIGKIRTNNEDNFFFFNEFLSPSDSYIEKTRTSSCSLRQQACFAVFDGMGGEQYGEEASFSAASTLRSALDDTAKTEPDTHGRLLAVFSLLNSEVCAQAQRLKAVQIGSTAAMLLFSRDSVGCCNVGDSRIYRLRDDELVQLSEDHIEKLPPSVSGKRKGALTQHLGIFPHEMIIEPYFRCEQLSRKDIFLICSDGLTDMVDDSSIRACLKGRGSVKKKTARLVDLAMQNGGRDNITSIVIEVR